MKNENTQKAPATEMSWGVKSPGYNPVNQGQTQVSLEEIQPI